MSGARRRGAATALLTLVPACALAAAGTPATHALSQFAGFDSIKTASVHYNLNTGDFSFPSHFTATRQGMDITADRASGNAQKKIMHASGNVVVHENAPATSGSKALSLTQQPSTLTADKLDVDGNTKIYVATGNMHFTQPGGHEASADRAVLDDATHHLHLEGNVTVRDGERTIQASQLDYDTETGQVDGNGDVTITAPAETPVPGVAATPRSILKRRRH